ncbi:MAG: tetratricopeptide repeat protein [Thermoplasmata archaeon]
METKKFPPIFADREKEIAILRKAMNDCKEGRGSTILITGEAGIGKTRLAEEFTEICAQEDFVVLYSSCVGNNEPAYLPVLSALEKYAKKVSEQTETYIPIGLAGFQSFEVEERNPNGLSKERTRALEHLFKQFLEISKRQPVLFVIDDLHYADSATLAFFHYLARNIKKERIIALAAYVEDYASGDTSLAKTLKNMNIERLYTLLKPESLGKEEIQLIVEQLGFEESEEIAKYIHERTSGHLFFTVEFLAAMKSMGVKDIENIKKMALPPSIKEIVKFRISKLSEKSRKVLVTGAILGRVFEYRVLKELVDIAEEELLDCIDELILQHFLFETDEVEEGYRFASNTSHEVVYGELSASRKRIMHQKAGEVIEKYHGGDEKFWSALAYHYRACHNKDKFVEYAVKAGKSAAKRFANDEAIEFLQGAIEVLGDAPEEASQKVELLWDLAEVLEIAGRYDDALETLKIRITHLTPEQPVEIGKSYRSRCEIYIQKGDYDNALEEVEKAEQVLSGVVGGELELARAWSEKGVVYTRKGEYKKAIELEEKANAVFERLNAEWEQGNAVHRIGTCYWYLGEFDKALEMYRRALEFREKTGDLRGMAGAYNNIGNVLGDKGDYEKALEFLRKSLELYRKIGDLSGIARTYNNIGVTCQDKGDYEKALEFLTKSLELKEKLGDLSGISTSCNNIGLLYHHKGNYEKALEFYRRSIELFEKIGEVWGTSSTYFNIGAIYVVKGDYEKALDLFTKSLELKEKIWDVDGIGWAYYGLGEVYRNKEEYEKALEFYKKSCEIRKEIGEKGEMCKSLLGVVECYLGLNDTIASKKYLEEARTILDEISMKEHEALFYQILGELLVAEGEAAKAEVELKKSIEIYERTGILDMEYHKTLFELGKIRKDKALLEKALAFFEKIGNKNWVERVRKEIETL